jgi:peptidoglycan/LPS O-acetylase OafA/YrhL
MLLGLHQDGFWLPLGGLAVIALVSAALTAAAATPAPVFSAVLTFPPVQWLGLRSYSAYLWHYPIIEALKGLPGMVLFPLSIVVTFGMAELSYRLIETPCRQLGRRFGRSTLILVRVP